MQSLEALKQSARVDKGLETTSVRWPILSLYMLEGLKTEGLQSIKTIAVAVLRAELPAESERVLMGLIGWKKRDARLRSGRWWPIMRM